MPLKLLCHTAGRGRSYPKQRLLLSSLKETQEKVVPDVKKGHPSTLQELMGVKQGLLRWGGEAWDCIPGATQLLGQSSPHPRL